MDRVDQIYESEFSIRMVLVDDNDLLNLNTPAAGLRAPTARAARRPATTRPTSRPAPAACCSRARRWPARSSAPRTSTSATWCSATNGGGVAVPRRRRLEHAQGGRLHRPAAAGRRLLRRGLRGPRDGPPVRRQPHVQRQRVRLRRSATATTRPRSSRAAARRSWPTPASASRTTCSRTATRTSRSGAPREITRYDDLDQRRRRKEVQNVSLNGFDTDGDSFTLSYNGVDSAPIVRGAELHPAGHRERHRGDPRLARRRDGRGQRVRRLRAVRPVRRHRLLAQVRRHAGAHRRADSWRSPTRAG